MLIKGQSAIFYCCEIARLVAVKCRISQYGGRDMKLFASGLEWFAFIPFQTEILDHFISRLLIGFSVIGPLVEALGEESG
tara:strand:+ start:365 stop:604 length:240 start_codon:yes stop_codon:yes gene_type:complete